MSTPVVLTPTSRPEPTICKRDADADLHAQRPYREWLEEQIRLAGGKR